MPPSPDDDPRRSTSHAVRIGWLLLGLLCVGLGIVGALLPLMPTTIFLILAAGCFAHSSPRLESWLLDHPNFGPPIADWRSQRAIPRSAKRAACLGIAMGYIVFWLTVHPRWELNILAAAGLVACAWWIVTRPVPASER